MARLGGQQRVLLKQVDAKVNVSVYAHEGFNFPPEMYSLTEHA